MDSQDPKFSELINSKRNRGYACKLARNIHRALPPAVDLGPLLDAAHAGLREAALLFDSSRGIPFLGFAHHYIRARVLDQCRADRRKGLTGWHASSAITSQLSASRELAYADDPGERIDRYMLMEAVYAAIRSLPPEMQKLVDLRYLQEMPYRAAAELMHLTDYRYRQLHAQVLALLKDFMTTKNIPIHKAHIAEVCDKLGSAEERIATVETDEYKEDVKLVKKLREEIKTWVPQNLGADKGTTFEGNRFLINVSEKRDERYVVDGGYKKIMGWLKDRFTLHCEIPFKYLDAELSSEQQAEVIRKGHVGYRSISTERLPRQVSKAA